MHIFDIILIKTKTNTKTESNTLQCLLTEREKERTETTLGFSLAFSGVGEAHRGLQSTLRLPFIALGLYPQPPTWLVFPPIQFLLIQSTYSSSLYFFIVQAYCCLILFLIFCSDARIYVNYIVFYTTLVNRNPLNFIFV